MPPSLALIICLGFAAYLIFKDPLRGKNRSIVIWVPTIWTMILGSRFVSQWLNIGGEIESLDFFSGGSPIDRLAFSFLIAASIGILVWRGKWGGDLWVVNKSLILFLIFAGTSVFWSDHPIDSFKRWVKEIGNLLMVMIILREEDPMEALTTVLRRTAYLMIPLSIVFIKYYPHLGRTFSQWTGQASNIGVTTSKNMLGALCLVSSYYFLWELQRWFKERRTIKGRYRIMVTIVYLGMAGWIYRDLDSITSLLCFFSGIMVSWAIGKRPVRDHLMACTIAAAIVLFGLWFADTMTNFSETVVRWLGRDPTLTDRKLIWKELLEVDVNRFVGAGYDSFWLRAGVVGIVERWHTTITHNGYLDTYLNLGWIGILLIIMIILEAYKNILKDMPLNIDYAKYKMGFLVMTLVYNYTETGFKGTSLIWLGFMAISCRRSTSRNYY